MISTLGTLAARTASAAFPAVTGRMPTASRTVYLTFDDGPSSRSEDLLEMLAAFDAPSTFFLRGDGIERYGSAVRRMIRAGHTLGNHSFRHLDAWRNSWDMIRNDLDQGTRALTERTGHPTRWMRPPYGHFRLRTLDWCRNNFQRLALWDVMSGDFIPRVTPETAAKYVVRHVRPGSIVVLHDNNDHHPQSLAVAENVLSELQDAGWRFDRLPPDGVVAH